MSKEMSEEAFNEIVDGFEHIRVLTEWGSKNIKQHIQRLQQENKEQKEIIDKAIAFYENNKQECVIGRTGEGKLRKDYYLPAYLSKTLINILKEVSE